MSMMEDFLRQTNEARAEQSALGCLQTLLQQFGKSLSDFGLPELEEIPVQEVPNADEMRQEAINIRNQLNPEQMVAADSILNALENNHDGNNIFFLDGPGGTGKTFTYNYIVREVLSRNMSVSTCAWIGIAATLLYKGKTVHSLFKLPVPVVDGSTCNIKPNSNHAAFLKRQHYYF